MKLVSDHVLADASKFRPEFNAIYPELDTFGLWNPNSWAKGQPFDLFADMRTKAPVMWSEAHTRVNGFWSITGYEDIKAIELKPDIYSSQRGSIQLSIPDRKHWKHTQLMEAAMNCFINLDAPMHMDMRLTHKDFFIPAYVNALADKVGAKIDTLLDDMERQGPVVDFVKLFSEKLPLFTICEMLGVDEEDRPKITEWMHYLENASQFMINPYRSFLAEPTLPFLFKRKVSAMFEYGKDIMEQRRKTPRQDLLSVIANAEINAERLPQEYLDGSWLLIIFAGNDTTRNSLSGALRLLTQFPDQRQMVLDDMSLVPNLMHESLRMVSPVNHMRRTALETTEFQGQTIAKDEKVVLWYGAGNRDARIFADPNRMDITRENADKHIAFGHGVHKCLGSRVAQMQLRLALTKILERFPNIHWTGRQKISPNTLVHAISSLEVNLRGK